MNTLLESHMAITVHNKVLFSINLGRKVRFSLSERGYECYKAHSPLVLNAHQSKIIKNEIKKNKKTKTVLFVTRVQVVRKNEKIMAISSQVTIYNNIASIPLSLYIIIALQSNKYF